jgi:hypothetical protein
MSTIPAGATDAAANDHTAAGHSAARWDLPPEPVAGMVRRVPGNHDMTNHEHIDALHTEIRDCLGTPHGNHEERRIVDLAWLVRLAHVGLAVEQPEAEWAAWMGAPTKTPPQPSGGAG